MFHVHTVEDILKPMAGYLALGIPFVLLGYKYPKRCFRYQSGC
jgi:hypothetical protein